MRVYQLLRLVLLSCLPEGVGRKSKVGGVCGGGKICNHDISKTITARSFKLGQLIEDNKLITW